MEFALDEIMSQSQEALSQGINHTPGQLFQQWQSSKHEKVKAQIQDQQQSSAKEVNPYGPCSESQQPPNRTSPDINHDPLAPNRPQDDQQYAHMSQAMNMQNTDKNPAQNITQNLDNECQLQRMQRMSNQQDMTTGQAANATSCPAGKQVDFGLLLPVIQPQLDRDRAMQFQGLYNRLTANNINKNEFLRHTRTLVGDHMMKMAFHQLQLGQFSAKQNTQKSFPYVATSSIHQSLTSSSLPTENNPQKTQLLEHQSDSHGVQDMDFLQMCFSTLGNSGGNYQMGASPSMNVSSLSLQMRQDSIHPIRMHGARPTRFITNSPNLSHWQPSMHEDQSLMSSMAYGKPDHMDHMNEQHKSQVSASHGPSLFLPRQHEQTSGVPGSLKDYTFEMLSTRPGFSTTLNKPELKFITAQLERQNVTHQIKPTAAQKKPLEVPPVCSPSKKQKVYGAFSDQSIEQLDDVTYVSGVNLREEEEQLFSGSTKETRVSEASRKAVQEEEERLLMQKIPLQKKVAEIMAKCGVKNKSNDVDRCLSLCVEARMHGLITNLIRLSKQRVNIEKQRHRSVITSDIWQQIMSLNQKAREERVENQADADKLQRTDEVNKEEGHKMRISAANVAARASIGGDDMLSKWKLMAEQACRKRKGGPDAASASRPYLDAGHGPKPASTSERNFNKVNPGIERTSGPVIATPGPIRKILRNQNLAPRGDRVSLLRTISVQDVISVLEREIQMSRSILTYHLYEQVDSDMVSELL